MDSDPPPRSPTASLALRATPSGDPQAEPVPDPGEDPDSGLAASGADGLLAGDTLFDSGAPLIGALIALATLLLPLASVLSDRPGLPPAPAELRRGGLPPAAALAGTRPDRPSP